MLDKAPLPNDTSIRDFQQGKVGYVANAVEQALLLPTDMAELRSMVSPLAPFSPFSLYIYIFIYIFFTIVFPSLIGHPSYV